MASGFRKKTCIVGTGGFGREVLCCLIDILKSKKQPIDSSILFMVEDKYYSDKVVLGIDVIPMSQFNPLKYDVVVAIGDPKIRKRIIERLPSETTYATLIHPNVVLSDFVEIGEGTIITAGAIITCNIKIGKHVHLNLSTTIGHDCIIGDFFTTAPGVHISGNCKVGDFVYVGTNAALKNAISIVDNVVIGMGAVVVKDITEEGVYIGNPLRRLK